MTDVLRFLLGLLVGACVTVAVFAARGLRVTPVFDLRRAPETDEPDEPDLVDIPDEVRALAERLLGATELYGAPELRAQLAGARATLFAGPSIGFDVPAGTALAVPGDANFPVVGLYRALDDRTFEVYLGVLGGHLSTLSVSEARDWTEAQQEEWFEGGRGVHELPGWPDPASLELFIETPQGLRPLS